MNCLVYILLKTVFTRQYTSLDKSNSMLWLTQTPIRRICGSSSPRIVWFSLLFLFVCVF